MNRIGILAAVLAGLIASGTLAVDVPKRDNLEVGASNPVATDVTMVALLAGGAGLEGRLVRVIGVLNLQFEGNALFLTREHRDERIWQSSLHLELPAQPFGMSREELEPWSGCYATVEGTFTSDHLGHLGMWEAGKLHGVNYIATRRCGLTRR